MEPISRQATTPFREFYKMNSKIISRVIQSLKAAPDVLTQARALCVNAALLAYGTNLNDDTWSATMQTITVDGDFRDKFAGNTVAWLVD